MHRFILKSADCRLWLLGLLPFVAIGCQQYRLWSRCPDIPAGAIPAPAGTYNDRWQQAQTSRADQDAFVFYQYEWDKNGDRLGPFGERHLQKMIQRAQQTAIPIVIEPSGEPALDERRLLAIKDALTQQDAAWSDYPVVVGYPEAEPMYGFESPRVIQGFMGGGGGGQGGGQGGGMGGGFGGGGGGGGGGANLGGGMF